MTNAIPMPCTGVAGRPAGAEQCPDQRGTLIATVAGSSLAFVVGSIINVALPAMQDEFATTAGGAQWIVNAYLLPLGAFVLVGGAAAGAIAPLAGGLIVDIAGWRWAFVAVTPLALSAWWVAHRSIRESYANEGNEAPLDWLGAALISAGLLALTWALTSLSARTVDIAVLLASVLGVALITVFARVEAVKGDQAMTPLSLFSRPAFAGLSLLTFFLYMALGGLLVLLPYVLIREYGYSATAAGAAILPFPLILGMLSRWMGGAVAERLGTRTILTLGPVGVGVGFLLLASVPAGDLNYGRDILPALVVMALGMAASVAPLTAAVLASAGSRYAGVASGINNAISRVAGLVATALLGIVISGTNGSLSEGLAAASVVGAMLALAGTVSAWWLIAADVGKRSDHGV